MNNSKPSAYTVLFWLIQDRIIDPNVLFDFQELFWPTFTKKHGRVFLKQTFSEEEYSRLVNENSNPEYWINLLTIDEYFSKLSNWEEKSTSFAKTLVKMWEAKLKKDFPELDFMVQHFYNGKDGDYGLTFYQRTKESPISNSKASEISHPNIKENKLEQSSQGPRAGIPKIRKPGIDEMPKDQK